MLFTERDPNSALPPPLIGGYAPSVYGEESPPFESFEDICPAPSKCPDCEAHKCKAAAKMYGLTVLPYETSLPGLPNRTEGRNIGLGVKSKQAHIRAKA